eukprot:5002251-Amphidinium_carterae.1
MAPEGYARARDYKACWEFQNQGALPLSPQYWVFGYYTTHYPHPSKHRQRDMFECMWRVPCASRSFDLPNHSLEMYFTINDERYVARLSWGARVISCIEAHAAAVRRSTEQHALQSASPTRLVRSSIKQLSFNFGVTLPVALCQKFISELFYKQAAATKLFYDFVTSNIMAQSSWILCRCSNCAPFKDLSAILALDSYDREKTEHLSLVGLVVSA